MNEALGSLDSTWQARREVAQASQTKLDCRSVGNGIFFTGWVIKELRVQKGAKARLKVRKSLRGRGRVCGRGRTCTRAVQN